MMTQEIRALISDAVEGGRTLRREETGFIHVHPKASIEGVQPLSIPVYENALFALALLKTRSQENVLEAKDLLYRLLAFQSPEGGMPLYLHQFPQVMDYCQSVRTLSVFVQIHRLFSKVLKIPDLEETIVELAAFSRSHLTRLSPAISAVLYACCPHGKAPEFTPSYTPGELSDWFLAWQMMQGWSLPKSWERFIPLLRDTWDPRTGMYVGPAFAELQRKYLQCPSFYHLICSRLFSCQVPLPKDGQLALLAAHIFVDKASCSELKALNISGMHLDWEWSLTRCKAYAYASIAGGVSELAFFPYRLAWKGLRDIFSLVVHKGRGPWSVEEAEDYFALATELGDPPDLRDRSRAREVALYVRRSPELVIEVEGRLASVFSPGEAVVLTTPGLKVEMRMRVEGEGVTMVGHIHPGNRPGQVLGRGPGFVDAYDWRIFLRTVERAHSCRVRLEFRLIPGSV